jgi:hypothetical protein
VVQQVVGELRDGEDVDQVEEQLDRPYLGLPVTPLAQLPDPLSLPEHFLRSQVFQVSNILQPPPPAGLRRPVCTPNTGY